MEIICLIFIFIQILILIYITFTKDKVLFKENIKSSNYAILIPARYEHLVIEDLLYSIEKQSFKIKNTDVYVIVEDLKDPTVAIVKKHKMNIILKTKIKKGRKGYALDDAIKYIKSKNKKYDAYFIFDADNVLDKDFVLNMKEYIDKGYDIGIGYRNTKNGNYNVVSACSSLTFSMIGFCNLMRSKYFKNVIISGTGFFVSGKLIDKWGCFPFDSLTEDYELTLYLALNNCSSIYNPKAIFYDEQPVKYGQSIIQRTRWIKGYFEARKKYIKKIISSIKDNDKKKASKIMEIWGVKPYIGIIVAVVIMIIVEFIKIFSNGLLKALINILGLFIIVYLILVGFTLFLFLKEKNKLSINKKMKIKAIFFNPIFLIGYIRCAIIALFSKNLSWKKIEHNNYKK